MTLGDKQRQFAQMVGQLLNWCYANNYEVTFGEAYRTPEQAALNASRGVGISKSLHTKRLAVDLNLFVDITEDGDEDIYQPDSAAYLPLGEYWESLGGSWGGRFTRSDGNHFSLSWQGVR